MEKLSDVRLRPKYISISELGFYTNSLQLVSQTVFNTHYCMNYINPLIYDIIEQHNAAWSHSNM